MSNKGRVPSTMIRVTMDKSEAILVNKCIVIGARYMKGDDRTRLGHVYEDIDADLCPYAVPKTLEQALLERDNG